jgi:RNA polymerase sigma-70 factor (ECF subfamily)
VPNETNEFIPTRESLLSRLKDWNDRDSWKEFFETYWKLIYRTALQAGLNDAEAQDVVQETVLSVAKVMPDFKYQAATGSFKHWLLKLTGWRIADQLRKRRPGTASEQRGAEDPVGTTTLERIPDPVGSELNSVWDEEWEKNLMEGALERVKRQVDARQYQMFDFYVLQRWPVRKVAHTLRVSSGRVYMAKHRISALIKKEIRRLKAYPPSAEGAGKRKMFKREK